MKQEIKAWLVLALVGLFFLTVGYMAGSGIKDKKYYYEGYNQGARDLLDTVTTTIKTKIKRDTSVVQFRFEQIPHDTFTVVLGAKEIKDGLK